MLFFSVKNHTFTDMESFVSLSDELETAEAENIINLILNLVIMLISIHLFIHLNHFLII